MDRVEKEDMRDKTKKSEINKKIVTRDYECSGDCRICPFPGAKCTSITEEWHRIQ